MIKAGVKGVKKSRINKILPQKKGCNFRFTAFCLLNLYLLQNSLHEFLESSISVSTLQVCGNISNGLIFTGE